MRQSQCQPNLVGRNVGIGPLAQRGAEAGGRTTPESTPGDAERVHGGKGEDLYG